MPMKSNGEGQFDLVGQLAQYGYPLVEPTAAPQDVLLRMAASHDVRIMEGFPIVFLHAVRSGNFSWLRSDWRPSEDLAPSVREVLIVLLSACVAVFDEADSEKAVKTAADRVLKHFAAWKNVLADVRRCFQDAENITIGQLALSPGRMNKIFKTYRVSEIKQGDTGRKITGELKLEILLSEIFSPRQKDLIRKRLTGDSFTKTEREYYYRVVKKRLKALADKDLHRFARNLLGR